MLVSKEILEILLMVQVLAMASMDMIKLAGGEPANFLRCWWRCYARKNC